MGGGGAEADKPAKSSTLVAEGGTSGQYGHQVNERDAKSRAKKKLSPPSSSETDFRQHINQLESSYDEQASN